MAIAVNREGLLGVTNAEYQALSEMLAELSLEQALRERGGGASLKDVVAQRAHWVELFLGWYAAGQNGGMPQMPAPGFSWEQLPAYNETLRKRQRNLGWKDALALLARSHGRLMTFLTFCDDYTLYGEPMAGGGNDWTTGRWAESAGAANYRSAAKFIRAHQLKERLGKSDLPLPRD